MKQARMFLAGLLALVALAAVAGAQPSPALESEKEAVIRAALDYSDGAYTSDAVRMERAIHPDLNKLIFMRRSPAMGWTSRYSTFSDLVEPARTGGFFLAPDKRKTETAVLEITDDIACLRIKTAMWCDYLQLIKSNGQWKIINVLWTNGLDTPPERKAAPGFDAAKEEPAARAAALDYLEGQLSGDAARLERALHQETSQIVYQVVAKTNAAFVSRTRYSGLLEPVKAKLAMAPENARTVEVRILDMMDGLAFAAARTGRGTAYLQLQLLDGQWKVINALVRPANNRFAPASANVRPAEFGQPMPDFTLPAIQGGEYGPLKLKGKNVLFVFPRGKVDDHWCQICHYQYAELADMEARLGLRRRYNLEIVYVLPYGEAEVRHWAEIFPSQMAVIEGWKNPPGFDKLDGRRREFVLLVRRTLPKKFDFGQGPAPIPFAILVDKDQAVSKMLGLFTREWDGSAVDQNVPTVFLLDASGAVRFKYMSQTTFDRPGAEYLIKTLDRMVVGK